eukprot:2162666-Ditylum_brightwellii.AAC.1
MMKIVKCKLVDTAKGKFDLVEAILEGDALTHWLKFKWVEVARMSKNPNGLVTMPLGMCNPTFTTCLQELKKHYFPKTHPICKKPTFTIILGSHTRFPAPGNNPTVDDELCNILYQMTETIVVDDNTDKRKKSSSQHTKSAKAKSNAKGKLPGKDKKKICVICQQFEGNANYHTAKDCYRHKLTKKLKKFKKQKGKHRSSYELESLDSDSDSS